MIDPQRLEPTGLRQAMGRLLATTAVEPDPLTGASDAVGILEDAGRQQLRGTAAVQSPR